MWDDYGNMMPPNDYGYNDMGGYNEYGEPSNYRGPKDNYFFSMDFDLMLGLGFTADELTILQNAVDYYGLVSTQKLSTPPFLVTDQIAISRIVYAYNICMGKKTVNIEDPVSLGQHLKKLMTLSGLHSTFSCFYIPHREITRIPRVAVIAGLPMGSFYCLNSALYDKMDATYKVDKIAQEWVTIFSERKMAVGYQDRLNDSYENREWGIDGILKVEQVGSFAENKPWILKIHKKYCRLCNRFYIEISTKKMIPGVTEHNGGYEVVTAEGQIVFVYARTTDLDAYGNPKDSVPTGTKDRVVVDYGFYKMEIEQKLKLAMQNLASKWKVVYSKRLDGETPYTEIPKFTGLDLVKPVVVEPEDESGDIE